MEESAWYAAYFLTGKYPIKYFPRTIPVIEIENCFTSDSQWSSAVSNYQRNCLQIVLEKLRSNGVEEFIYPWDSRYSQDPQEILNFVTTVYQESLSAYKNIVERWFSNFTRYLQTLNMFPVAIEGIVIVLQDGRCSLDWYWIPLKEGNSNRVTFNLAKAPINENKISILLGNARENRDKLISNSLMTEDEMNISFSHYHYKSSNLFTPKFPVTHIVYGWLWNDLEKLNLVSGRFDPHIW